MAKRTRITTSVSTLVTDIADLNTLCKVAGRRDLYNALKDLTVKVNAFADTYETLRAEVNDFKAAMLADVEAWEEEEEEEEVEQDA